MRLRPVTPRAFAFVALVLLSAPSLRAQSFEGLGFLGTPDGTTPWSRAEDVSADGSVVVGWSTVATGSGLGGAFRWDGAMQSLPHTYAQYPYGNYARGISADGTVTVGWSAGAVVGQQRAATRWVGFAPEDVGPPVYSEAYAASADGEVVVGQVSTRTLRWDGAPRVIEIGSQSAAYDVSADGAVMVGYAFAPGTRAYRWEDDEVTLLPGFPENPEDAATAHSITPDGTIIAGTAWRSGTYRMVRWVDGEIEELGLGVALGTSADGNVIVGHNDGVADARRALIWTPAGGVQDLRAFLTDSLGLDLTGWTLLQANAVSEDGNAIVGEGRNPSGDLEAWRATFRLPLVVNVTGDAADTDTGDGRCDADAAEPGLQCTLRAAIQEANAQEGSQAIRFNLPEDDDVITIGAALPSLTEPTEVVARPREDGRLGVRIDGDGLTADGLVASGGTVRFEGLAVTGFGGAAIVLGGSGPHVVEGCYVGVGVTGLEPGANGAGVLAASPNAVVRASVIAGNRWPDGTPGAGSVGDAYVGTGVLVATAAASGVRVVRSLLGVAADSLTALPNTVGVTAVGVDALVVEGNTVLAVAAGVRLTGAAGAPTTGARVVGNRLGLLPTNQIPASGPSGGYGVLVENAAGTIVGGATAQAGRAPGNVISGWNTGVFVLGTANGRAMGTRIAGNLVGLDSTGTVARPNRAGVWVLGRADDTRVGGWASGERNVISGSTSPTGNGTGVVVTSGDGTVGTGEPTGTVVAGNYIGTDVTGRDEIGHQKWGVYAGPIPVAGSAPGGAADLVIGATAAMAGGAPVERRRNVILGSGEANVYLDRTGPAASTPARVVGNWIGLDADGRGGITQSTFGGATGVGVAVTGNARAVIGGEGEDRNVVGGHRIGLWLAADEGVAVGNYVGTDPAGLERRANGTGVAVSGARVRVGLTAGGQPVPNVVSGNVLAGTSNGVNDGVGVWVVSRGIVELYLQASAGATRGADVLPAFPDPGSPGQAVRAVRGAAVTRGGETATDNVVAFNLVGTTAAGDAAVVPTEELNRTAAVWVSSGAVGTQLYANTISGTYVGIIVAPPAGFAGPPFPEGTRVAGNRIGLAATGGDEAYVPNRLYGLGVSGATDTAIGDGAVEGQGPNRIAGTGTEGSGLPPDQFAPGVYLLHPDDAPEGWPTGRTTLRRNLIYGNEGLAISYGPDYGVTPNGSHNTDGSASFDAPHLYQAIDDGADLTVSGMTNGPMTVEVFADRPCDALGHGEGRRYLGAIEAPGGAFEGTVARAPFLTWRVSATGTNVNGTTSEFSSCVAVVEDDAFVVQRVEEGETPTIEGPDFVVAVTDNQRAAGRNTAGAARAAGTLFLGLHRNAPDEGSFEGSATSDDGTTVVPNGVIAQRFWSVRTDSLDGITYEACLRYDNLFTLPVPEQLLVLTRANRGAAWAPHDSALRSEGGQDYLCADGLTVFGDITIGADSLVNPVPNEPGPDEGPGEAASAFALHAAAPNPFAARTALRYDLPEPGAVRLAVYDLLGREVAVLADGAAEAGRHAAFLDGRVLAAGVYLVRLSVGERVFTQRLTRIH